MGQVTSVGQIKPEDGVARLQARQHHRAVCGGARVRLNVGPFCAEQCAQPLDGQVLRLVHKFTSPVVTLARQALGILVGQDASLRSHDSFAGVVLGSDELGPLGLTGVLKAHNAGNFCVGLEGGMQFCGHGDGVV